MPQICFEDLLFNIFWMNGFWINFEDYILFSSFSKFFKKIDYAVIYK